MKKYLYIFSTLLFFSCSKQTQKTAVKDYEGIVIGKFRSWGGGIGLSMNNNTFSNISYKEYNHVVEALNIPTNLPNFTAIKFNARFATDAEKTFAESADGFELAPKIFIIDYQVDLSNQIDTIISACIADKITTYISKGDTTEVTAVYQYYYNGKICYLLNSQCCDFFNLLIDNNCNSICSPTGGITGGGDGTCQSFNKDAIFIREIWSK